MKVCKDKNRGEIRIWIKRQRREGQKQGKIQSINKKVKVWKVWKDKKRGKFRIWKKNKGMKGQKKDKTQNMKKRMKVEKYKKKGKFRIWKKEGRYIRVNKVRNSEYEKKNEGIKG